MRQCLGCADRQPGPSCRHDARSELMVALGQRIKAWNLSQEAAAARLGISRPRLNDLLRGKIDKFSLDALVNLVTAAGLHIEMRVAEGA